MTSLIKMQDDDIMRHKLVQEIIRAYSRSDA